MVNKDIILSIYPFQLFQIAFCIANNFLKNDEAQLNKTIF